MIISVILCTYNRSQDLKRALESVAHSIVPSDCDWEVLVVDNNSSDQTRELIEEFCTQFPERFVYIFEPKQGLSHARNAGILAARGDMIAFVDDDVIVESNWLHNLTVALQDGDCAGAGGRILPEREFAMPAWMSQDLLRVGGVLPFFDLGPAAGKLDRAPYGANMAYRREMFEKYGFFRTDLGRCGNSLISSEDTEFGRRLLAAGEKFHYEPGAIVYHAIPQERLDRKYFQAWWFGLGRSSVLLNGRGADVCGIPRPCFSIAKQIVHMSMNAVRWGLSLRHNRRFFFKLQLWNSAGAIIEFYKQLFIASRPQVPSDVPTPATSS
jgi:glucosyl-dolichyl phosphate glucuronosyltransferase